MRSPRDVGKRSAALDENLSKLLTGCRAAAESREAAKGCRKVRADTVSLSGMARRAGFEI